MQIALDGYDAKCTDGVMSDARPLDGIVAALGGVRSLAKICSVPLNTATSWRRRGAIPGRHWATIAKSDLAITKQITLAEIATLHAHQSVEPEGVG